MMPYMTIYYAWVCADGALNETLMKLYILSTKWFLSGQNSILSVTETQTKFISVDESHSAAELGMQN